MNIKLFFSSIFLLVSIVSFSQINSSFEDIQKKFGNENIYISQVENIYYEIKKISETETIKFTYNDDKIVEMIEIESFQAINNNRFHKLVKILNSKFKLTSSGENDNLNFYYDSKNKFLNIKVYKSIKKAELIKIIFISDINKIIEIIPDIQNWN